MPTTTLPPLAADTAVSAEARLAYVRRHLAGAYPGLPVALLGYAGGPVAVPALAGGFFEQTAPYPAPPTWREWQGRQLPFFFDNPAAPLLTRAEGRAALGADVVAAAFYLLSGWQEYFSTERDQHGRFPYAASVQARYNFVAVPVVNYYFEILKMALEHATGQHYPPRRWGPQRAEFAAFISHDVDNLRSAWKAPAKAALRQRKPGLFARLLGRRLKQPDAWDNLEEVAAATAQYGAETTFFILPAKGRAANGTPNADYELTSKIWQRLSTLACVVELHGSIGTAIDTQQLLAEDEAVDALGVRFHYLSWDPVRTPTVVSEGRFLFDSTLGFAEHYGFRHSYCLPFYPFNFAAGREANFLEIPLNIMDTTLHHPRYLQLAPEEVLPTLTPMLAEVKRFGGVASVLWHNENFDPANERNGPRQFHELLRHLQQQGAAFVTGRDIWQEFTAEAADSIHNEPV